MKEEWRPKLPQSCTPALRFVRSRGILNFDGNIHARGQVEFLQFIHRLGRGLDYVDKPLVSALFKGFLRFFVRMRGTLNGKTLDTSRQRDRPGDARAGAFDGIGYVAGGLVDDAVVIGLQSNANALSSHTKNNCL